MHLRAAFFFILFFSFVLYCIVPVCSSEIYVIQPCLSNNISIMRFNNHASVEQPSVITSGYNVNLTQPSDERALLKFDLSTLPKGKIVYFATLNLYCIGTYRWSGSEWIMLPSLSRTITVHRITADWLGWSFTYWDYATYPYNPWVKAGGDFVPATDSVNFEIPHQWNQWVVTKDIKKWYEGGDENYGWLLKDSNEGNTEGVKVEYMNWFYTFGIEYSPKLIIELLDSSSSLPSVLSFSLPVYAITIIAQTFFRLSHPKK